MILGIVIFMGVALAALYARFIFKQIVLHYPDARQRLTKRRQLFLFCVAVAVGIPLGVGLMMLLRRF